MILQFTTGPEEEPLALSSALPAHLLSLRIPYANSQHCQASYGEVLTQEIRALDCTITEYRLWLHRPVVFHPVADEATLALVYTLEGHLPTELHGYGPVELHEHRYQLIYIPAGVRHTAYYPEGTAHIVHVNLSLSLLRPVARKFPHFRDTLARFEAGSLQGLQQPALPFAWKVRGILRRIAEATEENGSREMFVHVLVTKLVYQFIRQTDAKARPIPEGEYDKEREKRVLELKKLVDEHTGKPLTLRDLQKRGILNVKQVKADFKAMFGKGFFVYQQERRWERAGMLVAETRRPFLDISIELGYNDHSSFTDEFKVYFQMTPSRYRKLWQEKDADKDASGIS